MNVRERSRFTSFEPPVLYQLTLTAIKILIHFKSNSLVEVEVNALVVVVHFMHDDKDFFKTI